MGRVSPNRRGEEIATRFAERMRFVREIHDISQAEVGRRVGLDPSAISVIESGKRSVSLVDAVNIARALDVRLEQLIRDL